MELVGRIDNLFKDTHLRTINKLLIPGLLRLVIYIRYGTDTILMGHVVGGILILIIVKAQMVSTGEQKPIIFTVRKSGKTI